MSALDELAEQTDRRFRILWIWMIGSILMGDTCANRGIVQALRHHRHVGDSVVVEVER